MSRKTEIDKEFFTSSDRIASDIGGLILWVGDYPSYKKQKCDLKYRDSAWLKEQYIDKELTMHDIAEQCNVAESTIHRWLHRKGIEVEHDRGAHTPPSSAKNHCELNFKTRSFLQGSLLGDGNLSSRSSVSARYRLGQKHRGYCEWVSEFLDQAGIEQGGKITKYKNVEAFHFSTKAYGEFKDIHKRWYPEGEKKVPKDLLLNPLILRHWFIEDGSSFFNNNGTLTIQFATNGFSYKGVEFLSEMIAEILCVDQSLIHIYEDKGFKFSFGEPDVVNKFYSYMKNPDKRLGNMYGYKWKGEYNAVVP